MLYGKFLSWYVTNMRFLVCSRNEEKGTRTMYISSTLFLENFRIKYFRLRRRGCRITSLFGGGCVVTSCFFVFFFLGGGGGGGKVESFLCLGVDPHQRTLQRPSFGREIIIVEGRCRLTFVARKFVLIEAITVK